MQKNKPYDKSALLPVLISLREKSVLITGSDERAECLAGKLASYTDKLTVDKEMSAVSVSRENLYGADVVISTWKDPRINDELFAVCRTLGIYICILDQPWRSDFILKERKA